jgi:hypothetical protein
MVQGYVAGVNDIENILVIKKYAMCDLDCLVVDSFCISWSLISCCAAVISLFVARVCVNAGTHYCMCMCRVTSEFFECEYPYINAGLDCNSGAGDSIM